MNEDLTLFLMEILRFPFQMRKIHQNLVSQGLRRLCVQKRERREREEKAGSQEEKKEERSEGRLPVSFANTSGWQVTKT